MHRFGSKLLFLALCAGVVLSFFSPVRCETLADQDKNAPGINVKLVPEGLAVIVSNIQKRMEAVSFGCDQDNNRIVIELPTDSDRAIIDSLKKNPNVSLNGVATATISRQMKRIMITPVLKLDCSAVKMVSRFQKYATYLYPAGRDLRLTKVEVKGFNADEEKLRPQISGALILTFDKPLGDVDLKDAVSTVENTLNVRLNPRDFVNQELLATAFPARGVTVSSSVDLAGVQSFRFLTIGSADISSIKAKTVKSPESNELRIDITLAVSLYETGKKLYEAGETRKALRYLDAARKEPASALVSRMSIGTIYWNEDNYAEAARNLKELVDMDKGWEFPEARYYLAKSYFLLNNKLTIDLSTMLKVYLQRCDRFGYPSCAEARELFERVNEPALKVTQASKAELKKLLARLADPRLNFNEVQKNIFHYWATWCPVCLEEMPRIMQYAVQNPNVSIYIIAKYDTQKNILASLVKAGAIRRKNIFYYIDTRDDIMLRQMVPLILANKEPVTPLPISVFLQRDVPFYLTDKLNWTEGELSQIWKLRYRE